MYRRRSDHTRNVYCDLRVGSYSYDQVQDGGLLDNDEERESIAHVTVPIDDKDYAGLRYALWRQTEARYREALADYSEKKAAAISTIDPNKGFHSFVRMKATKSVKYKRPEKVDEEKWVRFCKRASKWLGELPHVTGNWVEFDASQETKIFVSTEGSVIVQHRPVFHLIATLRHLTRGGSHIEQELVFNCASQSELPDMKAFKKHAVEKRDRLIRLKEAKKIHSFSGPVLLYPVPAGLLFHEAIGHRLEGNRLISSGEGRTFKGQVGKQIFNIPITIRDNPKLKKFQGKGCIGSYDYDDEGSQAQDTVLVDKGVLKGFLNTRTALTRRGHSSNGHARTKKYQRPISRMAVTIIEAEEPYTLEELKSLLIEEIRRQKKPFGMIVYETIGGETETSAYDFQAFSGEISYATLVYPDGKEVCVRGVNFVGTPLQAINNITAAGGDPTLNNGYCGAESGFIPISTISPAVLLKNLELQLAEEELVTQYILKRPRL